jgi:CheY-like chemotaxis protein
MDPTSNNYDLLSLLRLGDLNMNAVVEENPNLTVKDYFKHLAQFLVFAPGVTEGLNKIISLTGERQDFQNLAHVKSLLELLGNNKQAPVFGAILDAYKKGNMNFAAECAKRLLIDFSKLHSRILTATESKKSSIKADVLRGVTLKQILSQLDNDAATRKLRVLAVDDAPVMLKTITSALQNEYKVHALADPKLVEKFLQQITPDLILLDYKMPELNGFELVPIIRNFEEHQDTPIIFLTSMGTSDNVSAAAMLGACDFIVKPFDIENLREKIAKHIVRKKM